MAIFRKIYPRCWQSMIGLTPIEKTIALYLLSGPQSNRCGIYKLSIGEAIEDIETLYQTFAKGFERVLNHLSWEYDKRYRVVYIPTWWKWNQPENPNVLKSNLKDLDELPKTYLLSKFYKNTEYLKNDLIETFTQTLPQTLPQTKAESEAVTRAVTETEAVTRAEEKDPLSTDPAVDRSNGFKISQLAKLWNDKAPPELARVNLPFRRNPTKLKKLTSMLTIYPDESWWSELFARIHGSPFLCGRNDRGWKANFDFVVSRADEISDGMYLNSGTKPKVNKSLMALAQWNLEQDEKDEKDFFQ